MSTGDTTIELPFPDPPEDGDEGSGTSGRLPEDLPKPSSSTDLHLDSTQMLSYHSALGNPSRPQVPASFVEDIHWDTRYQMIRLLGSGAQGVVYLALREGVDGYRTRVAVKLFWRGPSTVMSAYEKEMRRIAGQAQQISEIQHDNLVNIRDFVSLNETRVMVMEWVDGLDLRHLVDKRTHHKLREIMTPPDWQRLNDVVATEGEDHCRVKPGVAVEILRGCLAGLAALHLHGIVHSDLKPANIMIKRTGTQKLIDMDSSGSPSKGLSVIRGTPYYMAPEQLEDHHVRFRSDVASLGYILIEMLAGRLIFKHCKTLDQLLEAKRALPVMLPDLLPRELERDANLVALCSKMVAFDPEARFPNADAADIGQLGASSFHRELVRHDLAADYDRELSWWVDLACPPEQDE